MLDKNMLVDDGWRPFVRSAGGGRNGDQRVRVSKRGDRLVLSGALWAALGSPMAVRVLWDPARLRVALEPASEDGASTYAVGSCAHASTKVVTFASVALALGLQVDKATVVPHELQGFRLILDLRPLTNARKDARP